MLDRESAERAVKDANPIIDGRKANVNLAYLGAKPRNGFLNSNSKYFQICFTIFCFQNCYFIKFSQVVFRHFTVFSFKIFADL